MRQHNQSMIKKYRRRRRRRNNDEQLTISSSLPFSLLELEAKSMEQLRILCKERGLSVTARQKLTLVARLLPYIQSLSFDRSETHEIVVFLNELGLSTFGTPLEKKIRLEQHFNIIQHVEKNEINDDDLIDQLSDQTDCEENNGTPISHNKRSRCVITPSTTPQTENKYSVNSCPEIVITKPELPQQKTHQIVVYGSLNMHRR